MAKKNIDLEIEIPDPPWLRKAAERVRRRQLSRDLIVETALAIIDREGVDGLSMRSIADKLRTGPASLYAHVSNKDELLDLVVDRVIGEVPLPEPDPSRWKELVKEWLRSSRENLKSHRDVARVTLGRVPLGPNSLRASEYWMGLLKEAGLPDRVAAYTLDLLGLYLGAYAYEESLMPPSEETADAIEQMRQYVASLPVEHFPTVVAMADVMMSGDADERFEFGIEVLVNGLEAAAAGPIPTDDK